MKKIFIQGIKGGVGTTVTVANLAAALINSGESVLAFDLNPQNELGLHFGMPWDLTTGWSNGADLKWLDHFQQGSDGTVFLPYGINHRTKLTVAELVAQSSLLDIDDNAWLLFDCPSYLDLNQLKLTQQDILINVINCDAACYSKLNSNKVKALNEPTTSYSSFYLINKLNSGSTLESDIYQLWRSNLTRLAPFFIHLDEAVKEAMAYKNVAFNYAPNSVVIDDYKTLVSWLVSKVSR